MNIKEAKEEIKDAMLAYFTKDEFGEYVIPVEHQRPVFLMGPPGIGKTEIMRQIAQELGVALVTYSMTHHTRQSALGLPFIVHKNYEGLECDISEYTMSEIIASVYEMIKQTGLHEGILFLDEINCVSETLAPAMLQFLQYKTFGRHRVPSGWVVVTAGNPPEYNNSVREFDVATWDRLKRMDVQPDYGAWKEYAYAKGVHPAVLTYLEIKKQNFYRVENTADGKCFVTARGWVDLSDMIGLYEKHNRPVKERLIAQYLQYPGIAKDFAVYYDLFNKYKEDYRVEEILAGKASAEIKERAAKAPFDEKLSLLGLLIDAITEETHNVSKQEDILKELLRVLKNTCRELAYPDIDPDTVLEQKISEKRAALEIGRKSESLSPDLQYAFRGVIQILDEQRKSLKENEQSDGRAAALLQEDYARRLAAQKEKAAAAGELLTNLFAFCEEVFPDGQELLILVTELTANYYTAHFIGRYGCESYYAHNRELLFYERQKEIITEMETLDWPFEEE